MAHIYEIKHYFLFHFLSLKDATYNIGTWTKKQFDDSKNTKHIFVYVSYEQSLKSQLLMDGGQKLASYF